MSRAKLQSNHHHQGTNIQFFLPSASFLAPIKSRMSTLCNHGLSWKIAIKISVSRHHWLKAVMGVQTNNEVSTTAGKVCTATGAGWLVDWRFMALSAQTEYSISCHGQNILYIRASLGFFTGGLRPKAESGVGFLGRGQKPPPRQLRGLGSAVSSPAGFWMEA